MRRKPLSSDWPTSAAISPIARRLIPIAPMMPWYFANSRRPSSCPSAVSSWRRTSPLGERSRSTMFRSSGFRGFTGLRYLGTPPNAA